MEKDTYNLTFSGCGQRGLCLLGNLAKMPDVEIAAVCDRYEDRTRRMIHNVEKAGGKTPFAVWEYRQIIPRGGVDAAVVYS